MTITIDIGSIAKSADGIRYSAYRAGDKIRELAGYIGVLDPLWGVAETAPARPVDWSSEVTGYYYVNKSTGTDAGRTYGTPTAPRATIPNPIPSGTVRVEVAGTYDNVIGGAIKLQAEGTASNKVWMVSDPVDQAVFTGAVTILYGSWFYVDGVDFTQTTSNYVILQIGSSSQGFASDHIMVRGGTVTGYSAGGPGVAIASYDSVEFPSNVIVKGMTIQDLNDTSNPADVDTHGINVTDYCEDIWLLDNTIQRTAGSGIQIGVNASNRRLVKRLYASKNNISQTRQSGIWTKNGTDIVVSQNTIDNVINASFSESKALGGQYFVEGVWWLFNTIKNCRYGIRVVSANGAASPEFYAIGNSMYNLGQGFSTGGITWDTCAIHIEGGDVFAILDNTVYDTVSGIHFSKGSDFSNAKVSGNVIKNITDASGYHIWTETTTQNGTVFSHNQYHDGTQFRGKNGATGSVYNTIASWQAATSNSVNDDYADPLLTSPATDDFTPSVGSPCLDSSAESTEYTKFKTDYYMNIQVDRAGNARPTVSTDWDRGAVERV